MSKKKITNNSILQVLPELTSSLKDKLNNMGVVAIQRNLIKHWAGYLSHVCNGYPSKQDYSVFSSTIVNAYPELSGPNNDTVRRNMKAFKKH